MFNEAIGFKSNAKVRTSLDCFLQYPVHIHTNVIEIICVLDGTVGISDSALSHKLSTDDVYIFNAKDPHKISAISEKNMILTVQIDISHYKRYFKGLDTIYFICDSFIQKDNLTGELRYLRFLLAKIHNVYQSIKSEEHLLEENVILLLKLLMESFQFYTYSKTKENSYDIVRRKAIKSDDPYYNRIYEIIDYIYENYNTKITLGQIAEREYLSIYYLSRYIKKACGLSFCELVSIARCEEAERLLGATEKTVDDIALEVGFANRKHFNTQFKKWFQASPSGYRKMLKGQWNDKQKIKIQAVDNLLAASLLESYLS